MDRAPEFVYEFIKAHKKAKMWGGVASLFAFVLIACFVCLGCYGGSKPLTIVAAVSTAVMLVAYLMFQNARNVASKIFREEILPDMAKNLKQHAEKQMSERESQP